MEALLELCTRPAVFLREAWWTLPLRLIVGCGFMEHGVAKLERGPQVFAGILYALHVPAAHLLAWATILIELIGGLAVLVGAFVPPVRARFHPAPTSPKRIPTAEIIMKLRNLIRSLPRRAGMTAAVSLLACNLAAAGEADRGVLVLTSTNDPSSNQILVYQLDTAAPALSLVQTLPTGGQGGAGGNAGILQMEDDFGAVANFGSNSVSELSREGDYVQVRRQVRLVSGCSKPDSVALTRDRLFVVGANCVESHAWPSGNPEGAVVHLTDASAAQVVVGKTWGAVTFTSGAVEQVGLTSWGALSGSVSPVALPSDANNTPLGAAFWGNIVGFTPAHSPDSFAIVDARRNVFPIVGPTPPYPANAPCWVAKGPGNVWYTGNSPGHAISIFFSDDKGGVFYKSVPLPGAPTDITVSKDRKWLAVIYSANGSGYVAVFAMDAYGDLALKATSSPVGVAAFNGVAISE